MSKWIVIALVLILLIFLPKIASTPLGKPLFTKAIEAKTESEVEIGSLELSWLGPQRFKNISWKHDHVKGTLDQLEISAPFWSFSGPFQLKNGSVLYKEGKIDEIEGQIQGNDFEINGATLQGHITAKGKVYSKHDFNIQIDMKSLPLILIHPELHRILGSTVDVNGEIKMEKGMGAIDLDARSPSITARLRSQFTQTAITLREPFTATLRFKAPLQGFQALNPVTVRIEPKDFLIPLPYSLEKVQIGQGNLDIGKATARNSEAIATLISLLKATPPQKQVNLWFTPVQFQLQNGTLSLGRMDALVADSIHLCAWGNIQLITQKLDLNLGLPADSLEQFLGIKNLPSSFVIKVPVRGTIQDPEVVKAPAATKIAALLAAGGVPGFSELFSKPKADKDIPPPNLPFPWQR